MRRETDILALLERGVDRQWRLRLWRDLAWIAGLLLAAPLLLVLLGGLNPLLPAVKAALWLIGLTAAGIQAALTVRHARADARTLRRERLLNLTRQVMREGEHPRLLDGIDLLLQNPSPTEPNDRSDSITAPSTDSNPFYALALEQIFGKQDPDAIQRSLNTRLHREPARRELRLLIPILLLTLTTLVASALIAPDPTRQALSLAPPPAEPKPVPPPTPPTLTDLQAILIPPAYTGWPADTLALPISDSAADTTRSEIQSARATPIHSIDTDRSILPGTTLILTGRSDTYGRVRVSSHLAGGTTHFVSSLFPFRAERTLMQSDTLQLTTSIDPATIRNPHHPPSRDKTTTIRIPQNSTGNTQIENQQPGENSTTESAAEGKPHRYEILLSPDRPPIVQWIEPATHLEGDPGLESLTLRYRAHDRIGLASLTLEWELHHAFVPEPITGSTPLPRPTGEELEARHVWDLTGLDLRPRDDLRFRITARDENNVTGPGITQTAERLLKIPSMADALARMNENESRTDESLSSLDTRSGSLRDQARTLQRQLRTRGEAGWQEEERLRQVEQATTEFEQELQSARQELSQLQEQIADTPSMSEETREAARRVAEMMDQLDSPELREALQQLREAMQSGEQDALSESLQNLMGNEEELQNRLRQTLQLFRDLKVNLQLDRMATQLDEAARLIDPEASPNDESDPESPKNDPTSTGHEETPQPAETDPDTQANRDREAESMIGQVIERLPDLGEETDERRQARLQELAQSVAGELEQTRQALASGLPSPSSLEIQRSTDNTQQPTAPPEQATPHSPTGPRQSEATRTREQARRLREARTNLQANRIELNIEGFERAFTHTLLLSFYQEEIAKEAPALRQGEDRFAEIARIQQRIRRQSEELSENLRSLSTPIPPLSQQLGRLLDQSRRALSASLNTLIDRNPIQAVPATRDGLAALNQLAIFQQQAIEQLKNQASGGAGLTMEQLSEQLMNLSGEQLEINRELQELINEEQGERLTLSDQERLDQLALEQNRLREELERLRQSAPNDERRSELEQTLRDMEEAIRRLREGRTDNLPEEQAEIHARMMRTHESLQQQGDPDPEQEREAQTARPAVRPLTDTPTEPPERTWESELRFHLADPRQTPFDPEVQELMERYIDQLRELE